MHPLVTVKYDHAGGRYGCRSLARIVPSDCRRRQARRAAFTAANGKVTAACPALYCLNDLQVASWMHDVRNSRDFAATGITSITSPVSLPLAAGMETRRYSGKRRR